MPLDDQARRLDRVEIATKQVRARGKAVLFEGARIGLTLNDFDLPLAVGLIDVGGAPDHGLPLTPTCPVDRQHNCRRGGVRSAVAAREAIGPEGLIVILNVDRGSLEPVTALVVAHQLIATELRNPSPVIARRACQILQAVLEASDAPPRLGELIEQSIEIAEIGEPL